MRTVYWSGRGFILSFYMALAIFLVLLWPIQGLTNHRDYKGGVLPASPTSTHSERTGTVEKWRDAFHDRISLTIYDSSHYRPSLLF